MTTATHAFVHYHKFCNLPAVNFMLKNLYTLFLLFSLAEAYHYSYILRVCSRIASGVWLGYELCH